MGHRLVYGVAQTFTVDDINRLQHWMECVNDNHFVLSGCSPASSLNFDSIVLCSLGLVNLETGLCHIVHRRIGCLDDCMCGAQ